MAVVLVVDDREVNRELVRIVLGKHGHQTISAADGAAALDLIKGQPPDIVVTDVLMPGMDGYQLVRALRADPATVSLPVIFYTANYLEEEARPIAAACGVSRIVTKTGDTAPLLEAVDEALREAPAPRAGFTEGEFNREHMRVLNAKLVEKLHELEEQNRLQQLVSAAIAVGADLSLPATLQRIVDAARSLLDARFAALGAVGEDHRFETVTHAGLTKEQAERIGRLPTGRGVLALPIQEGKAVRLADRARHMSSCGLPENHPAIRAFLGVPIVIDETIFGSLYVADKNHQDEFSAADENLLVALAAAGSVAISNAQRYDDAQRRHEWLSASADINSTLLAAEPNEALALVARGARRVAGADVAWIEVATSEQTVVVSAADGKAADELHGLVLPLSEAALFADVSATGRPAVINDATKDGRLGVSSVFRGMTIGALMVVPLMAEDRGLGALLIGNDYGRGQFNPLDVEMATTFAGHAALALEFAKGQVDRQRLTVLNDRDRIARNLHGHVIRGMFATGLGIQGVAAGLGDTPAAARLTEYVSDIDAIISHLRTSIFQLQSRPQEPAGSLHTQLLDVVNAATAASGVEPDVRFTGPIDLPVPAAVIADLIAVVREALTDIGRDARATRAGIDIDVAPAAITLLVSADGTGLEDGRMRGKLDVLRDSALRHGGTFGISTPPGGGIQLRWTAVL